MSKLSTDRVVIITGAGQGPGWEPGELGSHLRTLLAAAPVPAPVYGA